jgi:hypothetical protein
MSVSDPDVNREFAYFIMAYYFHFRPGEVDEMDSNLVQSLMMQLSAFRKREQEKRNG